MDGLGRLEIGALLLGLALAYSPVWFGLDLLFRGDLFEGAVYLVAGVVVCLLPILVLRRVPRPGQLLRAGVQRLRGRLGALIPGLGEGRSGNE